MGNLDFISIDFWHILIAMMNLIILAFILKKFLFKPVNDILRKRQEEVDKIYTDADQALKKAEADRAFYEDKMKNAEKEADNLIKAASVRAGERSDEIINNARQEAVHMISRAEDDIALKRKKAVDGMKDDISDMVIDLAGKVVDKEIDQEIHENLIEEAIENLGEK